ncbi:MAG: DUF1700 domain-containing protein [Clostridia bacterium]|nr:DUF1700 domain-containing protein [Clostridia bacterium]
MNKEQFLKELEKGLSGLPQEDIDERLSFYGEMIDDRMEEGLDESEAVAGIGSVSDIVAQTLSDIPLAKLVKEKVSPQRKLGAWEIVLIVLGFPIWFSLIIAAAAVVLSLYAILWALLISLWAVLISLWVCAFAGVASAAVYAFRGFGLQAVFMLGAGLLAAGLSIFMFYLCKSVSKAIFALTKKIALGIKKMFVRKERSK